MLEAAPYNAGACYLMGEWVMCVCVLCRIYVSTYNGYLHSRAVLHKSSSFCLCSQVFFSNGARGGQGETMLVIKGGGIKFDSARHRNAITDSFDVFSR